MAVFLAATLHAQESPERSATPVVFSGTVVQASSSALTVNRKGLGKTPATKTFAIDSNTRIEGKIRLNVKVTVQFLMDENDRPRAIYIIVR